MDNKSLVTEYEVLDGVKILTINNPPLNFITTELLSQLDSVLTSIERDNHVRTVIITGTGERAFSAGSDLNQFRDILDTIVESRLEYENYVYERIASLHIPTIAAIQGTALGGGLELALACDMRVISSQAHVGFPEIKLGWFPGSGGLYRLPYLVGQIMAKELMFLGEPISAARALQIGLVNQVVENDRVLNAAQALARKISKHPNQAIRAIKKGVNHCFNTSHEELVELNLELSKTVFSTEDAREGIEAFFGKRPPEFRHK